jgi:hypothetical protein
MLTTGARHPYTLDEKYLHSRKVTTTVDKTTGDFDPRLLSGYQLKELIWIDWRSEWEPRPANPSFIRLILMGRMLEDKVTLRGTIRFRPSSLLFHNFLPDPLPDRSNRLYRIPL